MANYLESKEKDGKNILTIDITDCNLMHLANIVFDCDFSDRFFSQARIDHETGGMPSNFWEDISDAMNGAGEDDGSALTIVINEDDPHAEEIHDVDLQKFDLMTSDAIKKNTSC